jgi:hypothetical protein
MPATTVTREDLYRLVWETPITRLAASYGITGTGLKKICDRLDVPVPPRGYWARKEAGQPVVQFRLLKAKADTPLSVVIHPTPPKEKPAPVPVPADNPHNGVKDGALSVPDRLHKPHPVIAAWIDARKNEREASRHRPWGNVRATVPDFSTEDQRRHRILNALFRALESGNHAVTETRRGDLEVKLGGKPVSFRLREKLKQVQRPLTDDEKRWGFSAKNGYRKETVGSGFLIFEIQSRLPGQLKSTWLETEERRMEDMVGEIFATMQAAAPLLEAERLAEEDREARRREEEARRREEERLRKIAENRLRRFGQLADQWDHTGRMRAFLAEMKALPHEPDAMIEGRSLADWIAWLEARIEARDPLSAGSKKIFEDLATVTEWWREA